MSKMGSVDFVMMVAQIVEHAEREGVIVPLSEPVRVQFGETSVVEAQPERSGRQMRPDWRIQVRDI